MGRRAGVAFALALAGALGVATHSHAQQPAGDVSQAIGNSGVPLRFSLHAGPTALQRQLADFMQGGTRLELDIDVPLRGVVWLEVPFATLRHRGLRTPLRFPYTVPTSYEPAFADARGYYHAIGLGVRLQPHVDLEQCYRESFTHFEPSLRAGMTRVFIGWEPRPEAGGGPPDEYKSNVRFARQSGWGQYAGVGIGWTRYSTGDVPAIGIGAEYCFTHESASGDALLPQGTETRGVSHTISVRLTAGTR